MWQSLSSTLFTSTSAGLYLLGRVSALANMMGVPLFVGGIHEHDGWLESRSDEFMVAAARRFDRGAWMRHAELAAREGKEEWQSEWTKMYESWVEWDRILVRWPRCRLVDVVGNDGSHEDG